MNFCVSYFKSRLPKIILFGAFIAVFAISFALYRLPIKAVLYPAGVCALIALAAFAADYCRAYSKHRGLEKLSKLPAEAIELSPASDLEDEDWREIVLNLKAEISELSSEYSAKLSDMTEYYTVWVHQIKTPIASVRLALQGEDSPLSRKISSDIFRIEQYVGMVLAFMRLESPTSDYLFRECSLDKVIKEAVRGFAPEFIDRRLKLEYSGTDKRAVSDEKWLCFVIEQLLSNALKYTREGGVKIYVDEPATLCIEDSGIGIAPEDLPRVFEKGYTGLNGRADKRASGLGLYLCKRVCEKLGAKIEISSKLDCGTKVSVDLSGYNLIAE